ncbi:MAG: hypothetical protein JNL36_12200 [Candidatus Kapabacteria bacterium]|nr:hypothetical protein [Candidatus Kapabacteria bacterium]
MKCIKFILTIAILFVFLPKDSSAQTKKEKKPQEANEYVALWGSVGTNFSDGMSSAATLRFWYLGISIGRSGKSDKTPTNYVLDVTPLDFDPPDTSFTLETFRRPTTTIDISGFYPLNQNIFLQGSLGIGVGSDAVLANNEGQYFAYGKTNERTIVTAQIGLYYDMQPFLTGISWHTNRGLQLSAGFSF